MLPENMSGVIMKYENEMVKGLNKWILAAFASEFSIYPSHRLSIFFLSFCYQVISTTALTVV